MKYIYLLFLFCLFGCTRTTNKQSNIKNIYLEQSNIQDFIGLPIQLTTLDSVLFINDFYGDSLIHCISLKDNKPIAKLGVKGSGPNEVLSPLYIFIKEDSLFLPRNSFIKIKSFALRAQYFIFYKTNVLYYQLEL